MGTQATENTGGAGKTAQPPAPDPNVMVGNLKPQAVAAPSVSGFSFGPGSTGATAGAPAPSPVAADGTGGSLNWIYGNGAAPPAAGGSDVGQTKPLAVANPADGTGGSLNWIFGGGGTPAPAPAPGTITGDSSFSFGGGGGFGAPPVPSAVSDESRRRVEQAILARLEPQFKQDEERMRNQLLSSGLEVGSPAYAAELDRLQRGQNDARQQAILTGGTEESRQVGLNSGLQNQAFNQGLQGAQFDNATRQQMLAELLLQRNTPLNELNSLRTGSQVAMPNFQGYYTNNSAPAPIFDATQAQGQYDMAASQQQQSGFNSLLGGLATLGGAGIMRFSDLRLKTEVKPIGRTAGGHILYSWKWADGSGYDTGVIAQEVQKVRPDAVMEDASGYLLVDYSKIH